MNFAYKLKSISKIQILAIILIVIGLGLTIRYGIRMASSYRALQFARTYNFEAGEPDPELIRPWMNIRYIAVAYTVPQEYLLNELGLAMTRENSITPLNRLNYQLGLDSIEGRPVLIDKVQEAILKYRANPVPTGLKERGVREWMSVQYIANSTGIPAETIFEQIGLPIDGYAYMSLDQLSEETGYEGGVSALVEAIQRVVDNYGVRK